MVIVFLLSHLRILELMPGVCLEIVLGVFVGADVDGFCVLSIAPTRSAKFPSDAHVMLRIWFKFSATEDL